MSTELLKITKAIDKDKKDWDNYLKKKKFNIPINKFSFSEIVASVFSVFKNHFI